MTVRLALIVAMDRHRLIGADGKLPWHLPADLRWFKQATLGKPVIMGRRTYESIGRALPGRDNIVLTRNRFYQAKGCLVVHSVAEAMAAADAFEGAEEAMVIGGAQIYRLFLPHAHRLYLTTVDAALEGDTHFPELDQAEWREASFEERAPDGANPYGLRFAVWERVGLAHD